MKDEQKIQILERTLDILGENGENWLKEDYGAVESGRYCLAGAVCQAAIDTDYAEYIPYDVERDEGGGIAWDVIFFADFGEASDALTREISLVDLVKQKDFPNVPKFNDDDDTDWEDVRALVEERLSMLRGESD